MAPSVEKLAHHGGVFHCYIAAYGHKRPRQGQKPSVEGRAGPREASDVRRRYTPFPGGGKGLIDRPHIAGCHPPFFALPGEKNEEEKRKK